MFNTICLYVHCYCSEAILDVVAFHDKVSASGFKPDQSMPQMMCEEFYGCNKELEAEPAKKRKGDKKSKSSKAKGSAKEL